MKYKGGVKMRRLEGKVAIITGAASGIGKGDAELFAKEGAKVVITTDAKVVEGKALAEKIKKEGGEAIFLKLDVTKEGDWKSVIGEVIKRYGKLNILVNNAGVVLCKTIEETSLADWNWQMDINSTGVFLGTKYAIEAMKGNGELCSIINRGSVDAIIGDREAAAYCASKGAVRLLTKAAALHCAELGYTIRVNAVHPGGVDTPMLEGEAKDLGLPYKEYLEKTMLPSHPVGFLGEPIDIAYMDLYLASDESRWVTGADFIIDGGLTAI
jgi:NAD(P)-dependent dehydrogenase (short-subunit alcohol dehydrogenase family)